MNYLIAIDMLGIFFCNLRQQDNTIQPKCRSEGSFFVITTAQSDKTTPLPLLAKDLL